MCSVRDPLWKIRERILEALQSAILFPRIGRLQKVEGVRKLVTRKYPYLVYYTADEAAEEIMVLTILHGARERGHGDT